MKPKNDCYTYLTPIEAADYLRLSVPSLKRFRQTREGPAFIKLGTSQNSRIRYRICDLDAWVEARRRTNTSEGSSSHPRVLISPSEQCPKFLSSGQPKDREMRIKEEASFQEQKSLQGTKGERSS